MFIPAFFLGYEMSGVGTSGCGASTGVFWDAIGGTFLKNGGLDRWIFGLS